MCFLKERARSEWPADNPWVQTPIVRQEDGEKYYGIPILLKEFKGPEQHLPHTSSLAPAGV